MFKTIFVYLFALYLDMAKYKSAQLRNNPLKMLGLNKTAISMTDCALKCNTAYIKMSR